MNKIVFKELRKDSKDTYKIYKVACDWDKNNTWKTTEFDDLEIDMCFTRIIGLYNNDTVIGLGTICYLPIVQKNYVTISCIIRPEYRKKGYATMLINKLIEIIKNVYDVEKVRVEIFKNNIASITLIENSNFEFLNFDDEIITYEKKLKYSGR